VNCKHCNSIFEKHHYKQVFCKPECKIAYWKDPQFQKVYQIAHKKANPEKRIWKAAKDRSSKHGIPFNIEVSDVVIPEVCPILGIEIVCGVGSGKGAGPGSPSLDKIVPELGYVKGNVQVVSFKANAMKRDATKEELIQFANWILKGVPK